MDRQNTSLLKNKFLRLTRASHCLWLMVMLIGCGGIPAQECSSSDATLSGVVKNEAGIPIEKAFIEIQSVSMNCPFDEPIKSITVTSDQTGFFTTTLDSINETETIQITVIAAGYKNSTTQIGNYLELDEGLTIILTEQHP